MFFPTVLFSLFIYACGLSGKDIDQYKTYLNFCCDYNDFVKLNLTNSDINEQLECILICSLIHKYNYFENSIIDKNTYKALITEEQFNLRDYQSLVIFDKSYYADSKGPTLFTIDKCYRPTDNEIAVVIKKTTPDVFGTKVEYFNVFFILKNVNSNKKIISLSFKNNDNIKEMVYKDNEQDFMRQMYGMSFNQIKNTKLEDVVPGKQDSQVDQLQLRLNDIKESIMTQLKQTASNSKYETSLEGLMGYIEKLKVHNSVENKTQKDDSFYYLLAGNVLVIITVLQSYTDFIGVILACVKKNKNNS